MKKPIVIISSISLMIMVGGAAFYGGMKYTESKDTARLFSDFNDLTAEQRAQRIQQFGANVGDALGDRSGGFIGRSGITVEGQMLSGEIISQEQDSFTIKLADGSTKIIFISDNTKITKTVDGSLDDLKEGERVFLSANDNPDGSYTAISVQLSPFVE